MDKEKNYLILAMLFMSIFIVVDAIYAIIVGELFMPGLFLFFGLAYVYLDYLLFRRNDNKLSCKFFNGIECTFKGNCSYRIKEVNGNNGCGWLI